MISEIINTTWEVIKSKNQNSSIIREKVRKRWFYCRFGGKYRQWRANRIYKIIYTTWESLDSKNKTLKLSYDLYNLLKLHHYISYSKLLSIKKLYHSNKNGIYMELLKSTYLFISNKKSYVWVMKMEFTLSY
jgi:hypothetical protein